MSNEIRELSMADLNEVSGGECAYSQQSIDLHVFGVTLTLGSSGCGGKMDPYIKVSTPDGKVTHDSRWGGFA